MSSTPQSTAGIVSTMASARRIDWKFAASSRKITSTASSRPMRKPGDGLFERRNLAAQFDGDALGRRAGAAPALRSVAAPLRPA